METKINEEYQKLIDKINKIKEDYCNTHTITVSQFEDVVSIIQSLGIKPVLSNNVEQFMSITQDMTKTYAAKNHDYGNSFEQSLNKFGLVASVVRIGDKMNRIESLMKREAQVKDESIKDTLLDMANYCIMTVMWMDKVSKL